MLDILEKIWKKKKLVIVLFGIIVLLSVFKFIPDQKGLYYRVGSTIVEEERVILYRKLLPGATIDIGYACEYEGVWLFSKECHNCIFAKYKGEYYNPIHLVDQGVLSSSNLDDLHFRYMYMEIPEPEIAS